MADNLRKLNALDFSTLMRQTAKLENLDFLRVVTNGEPMSLMGMASSLFAQRHAGAVLEKDGKPLAMARVIQWQEEDFAQFQFISALEPDNVNLSAVIEALLQDIGEWGLIKVMADLPVSSPFLKAFRKANFYVWASHQCFTFPFVQSELPSKNQWETWTARDFEGIRAVYQTLVPSRIRSYEPMTRSKVLGKVLTNEKGQVIAYVDLDYGSKGLWAQPFALPEANRPAVFEDLLKSLFAEYGRPVTFSARSYMPWLRSSLGRLTDQMTEERALIARYLALRDRLPEETREGFFEKSKAEGTVFTINRNP